MHVPVKVKALHEKVVAPQTTARVLQRRVDVLLERRRQRLPERPKLLQGRHKRALPLNLKEELPPRVRKASEKGVRVPRQRDVQPHRRLPRPRPRPERLQRPFIVVQLLKDVPKMSQEHDPTGLAGRLLLRQPEKLVQPMRDLPKQPVRPPERLVQPQVQEVHELMKKDRPPHEQVLKHQLPQRELLEDQMPNLLAVQR